MDVKKFCVKYSLQEFDPENREINRIVKLGNLKGKKILIIGTYGMMAIAPKIQRFSKNIFAVHSNKEIVSYCQTKTKSVNFQTGNIMELKFPDKYFDVIISPCSGLPYNLDKSRILRELKRVLGDNGTLLIEENDETSEFSKVLDLMSPRQKLQIKEKREEFLKLLEKSFKIRKAGMNTYYVFRDQDHFVDYFRRELEFSEGRKLDNKIEKDLGNYLAKRDSLKIKEQALFLVCKKKLVS